MTVRFQMIDIDTGEILGHTSDSLAFNFHDKKDVGFRKCLAWCQSSVRGLRLKKHDKIELRIAFLNDVFPETLPLTIDGIEVF